jgi:hypothetical protein
MTVCQRLGFCWLGSRSYAARVNEPRVMAIDWSGRSGPDQRRALWRAEAVDGELVRLEGGRTRAEIVELLIAEADRDPNLIVGVDFAFSLPAWYRRERQLAPRQLWVLLADEALIPTIRQLGLTRWMNRPELPFWITGEAHAQLATKGPTDRSKEGTLGLPLRPSGCSRSAPSTASAPHLIVHTPQKAWWREEAADRREAGGPSPWPVFGGRGRENDSSSCPV